MLSHGAVRGRLATTVKQLARRRGTEPLQGSASVSVARTSRHCQQAGLSTCSSSSPLDDPLLHPPLQQSTLQRRFITDHPTFVSDSTKQPVLRTKPALPSKKGVIRASSSASALFNNGSTISTTNGSSFQARQEERRRMREVQEHLGIQPQLSTSVDVLSEADAAATENTTRTAPAPRRFAVPADGRISIVQAVYAAKTIDLAALVVSEFARNAKRKKLNRSNLLLELSTNGDDNPSYVVIYRFGSVIFFNMSPRNVQKMLAAIKKRSTDAVAEGFERRDTFGVCVSPSATQTKVTSEHCIVPALNMSAAAVISEVMAQSVALDSYNDIVDSLLDNFAAINSNISETSKVDLDKQMLFSKIAQNNRIFIDLISKLRIKGRSEIAWDQGEYEVIHAGMVHEFDINDRFELIQFKLDLIQQNSKLFLEVIHHQKASNIEWIIVVLIGFECILMCMDMSGTGTTAFAYAKSLVP